MPLGIQLVMDIGGGSVEFVIGDANGIKWSKSFEIGAQRLLDRYHQKDPIEQSSIDSMNEWLTEQLEDLINAIKTHKPKGLIGCSGTFDTIKSVYTQEQKITPPKGDGLDVWLKKDNVNYLLELKSPQVNAGNGNDFSHKLMKQYLYHLFWEPDSKVKVQLSIPYNPYNVPYEQAIKGRISPLLKDEDYLVDNNYWKFITGNENSMKLLKESFNELKNDGELYKRISSLIKHFS